MTSPTTPSITIFGSTGGTGLAFLRHCLAANLPTTVLVRTPSKLLSLLKLSSAPSNLRIIPGNINSAADTKAALTTPSGQISDIILSSVGFVPDLSRPSLNPFANIDDTSICENATRTILAAIAELKAESSIPQDPLFIVLSTTGISDVQRDIPIAMIPLYHWLLALPHKDKKAMEDVLQKEAPADQRWIIVRPSLLSGDGLGEGWGLNWVKVGVERGEKVEKTAIGYRIMREDVGTWIFEETVQKRDRRWEGAAVGLTY